ncbi:hypothetical protein FHU36_007840 [Nonomuraea muscovyensis]|uniref:Uncharacterized protein n=1 Tax=Nonomuraea muscovyensis TaxID=1124761 RepID=A0A7X0F0F9_9ACTN|nr:hypothetical protein [Nonomuraea muscovyensis]MBB6351257.1 hypothetical protein [Nonomuraea muscovyensis]
MTTSEHVLRAELLTVGDFLAFDPTDDNPFAIAPADPNSSETPYRIWGQITHVVAKGLDWRPCSMRRAEVWFTCKFDAAGAATLIVGVDKNDDLLIRENYGPPLWMDYATTKPPWEI